MGLAGHKQKQRIPADPRNLSWADDASRFGLAYLSKFGWDASQGLGPSGDGMKTHIKVQQKLNMMGIGAQHQRDPNGIAWKQNKEFEALLKRLNENTEQENGEDSQDVEGETTVGFVRAQEEKVDGELGNESSVMTKKRKHKDREEPGTGERKSKKQRQKSSSDDPVTPTVDPPSESPSALPSPGPQPEPVPKPRPMAHRARMRAAKRISDKSASAISEILGIAPSSSVSTSASSPAPTPPPTSTPDAQPSLSLDNLTTSTKSVADYFKEKLLARSISTSASASSSSSSSAPSGSATPGLGAIRLGLGFPSAPPTDDDGEPPRRGIGSHVPAVDADGQDTLTEKQCRKAERKAEKRKRREAEAGQVASGKDVSIEVKEQTEEDGTQRAQRTSKKDKKRNKRRAREQQQASAGQSDESDDIPDQHRGHDTRSDASPESPKKSKREHKKNRA